MSATDDLACNELVEIVTDYLEGSLPPEEEARFEDHLAICEGCRTYLEQMRLTIRVTGKLSEESIPPPAKRELLRAFRNWKRA